jgi:hypothetical protein
MTLNELIDLLIENKICVKCLYNAQCINDCKSCYHRLFEETAYTKIIKAIDNKKHQLDILKYYLIIYDEKSNKLNE